MPSSPYADLLLRCCQGELFALAPEGEENLLGMARNTEVGMYASFETACDASNEDVGGAFESR